MKARPLGGLRTASTGIRVLQPSALLLNAQGQKAMVAAEFLAPAGATIDLTPTATEE